MVQHEKIPLETLYDQASRCRGCELWQGRTNLVFGVGNPHADVLIVGEAPGEQEDLSGTPFVGRAGQLFDRFLYAVDIDRKDVYIANILKCRPPKNRDPLPEEEDACLGYLREQVKIIQPKLIVCLGRISAMRLISPDFRITRDHGKWFDKGDFSMCAVYHPSLLLRDPRKREDMMTDLLEVKRRLDEME
jgi:DNA polymerase